MALPGFRPSVQLSEDPPRLTDKTSGRTLTISRGEARLLSLYDGVKTHDQLAQQAQAAGFAVDASHVAGLLERVAHAGFMSEPPPSALTDGAGDLEQSTDLVPALRSDLNIKKSEKSPGLLEVTDPTRGQTFSLYDFEVSIARMLNGKRTAGQVIDAAAKIGIPVTLESLRKFVKQLRAYRFVTENRAPPVSRPGGTWSPRSAWKPEVRELFQSALRKFRAGKPDDATDYIVALLQIDPDNAEARDLQQRINQKLDTSDIPEADEFTFDELHGGADAAPDFVEFKPAGGGTLDITSAAPEHLPMSVTGAPKRTTSQPATPAAAPARTTSQTSTPARTASQTSAPMAAPPRSFSPPAGSPSAWPVGATSSAPLNAESAPPPPPAIDEGLSATGVRRTMFDNAGSELTSAPAAAPLEEGQTPSFTRQQMFAQSGGSLDQPSAPAIAPLGETPTPSVVRKQMFEPSGLDIDAPPTAQGPAVSSLLADAATPSDVRRKMFDKSQSELTDEPPQADLGEPLDLGRRTVSQETRASTFAPEPLHLQRTNTGEQQVRPFDPPPLELDHPAEPQGDAEAAASQAEAVWAPPQRRTQPPRPSTEDEAPKKKRSLALPIAAVVALLLIAGAAAFPVPMQERKDCQLAESEAAQATAPSDVKIKELLVKDGDAVESGKPVATIDTSATDKRIKSAEQKEAALTAQLAALDKKVKPAVKAKAEAALNKAKKPLTRLETTKAKLEAQKAKLEAGDVKKPKVKKALAALNKQLATTDKAIAKEEKKVAVAQKAFDKVTFGDKRKPLVEGLAAAKADKEAAKAELGATEITAPASGTWKAAPEMSAGAELKTGGVLGSILNSDQLALTSEVTVAQATLIAGSVRKPVSLNGGATQVDNADGALKPGACSLEFLGAKQPLYKRYIR